MKTTYATMHKTICLDKATDSDGLPAPITFSVKQVQNGHQAWQKGIIYYHDADTLAFAIKELHSVFRREMSERGYTYCEMGSQNPFTLGLDTPYDTFDGESGWYCGTDWELDICDYPASDYPLLADHWVKAGITSYGYDNYTVCIVTSNGDLVY